MTFLRNAWYPAALSDELQLAPVTRRLLGEPVLIYRKEDGAPVAIGGVCPHRFASLGNGRIVNDQVQCPYHGLRFDQTGACVFNPHGPIIPPNAKVPSYPLCVRHGVIWIWMGDPELADPDLLVCIDALFGEGFGTVEGYLHVKANYQLVMDNLLDLSHVMFLHPHLSGSSDGDMSFGGQASFSTSVQQDGQSVVYLSAFDGVPVSPHFKALWPDAPDMGNLRGNMRWNAPAVLQFDNGVKAVDGSDEVATPSVHLLTPETEWTTHYFWRFGRNKLVGIPEVDEAARQAIEHAFVNEDEQMIADVQLNMGTTDLMSLRPALLESDRAPIRARRILKAMIATEIEQGNGPGARISTDPDMESAA